MTVKDLPALNAVLNSVCSILLIVGFFLIRKKRIAAHRRVMLTAFGVSVAFMASYLIYHFQVGSVKFSGEGVWRAVYFAILFSHTVLAIAVPPLAVVTLFRGLSGRYESHRKIARWTLPIWLYVSVTGVLVYLMLYRWFSPPGGTL